MDFAPTHRQRAAAESYADTAGLPGLPLPEQLGGAGLSITELAALLHEAGRHADGSVAPLMTGALPLARWGGSGLGGLLAKRPLVATALRGRATVAACGAAADDGTVGVGVGGGAGSATVSGTMTAVPYCAESDYVLVAADDSVVIVESGAPGVTVVPTRTSSGEPEATLRLDRAPVHAVLGGADCLADIDRLAVLAACCLIDGALAAALELTGEHVSTREQFGKPLATFQAVAQRIADIAIASRTVHLVTLAAAWRLERSMSDDPGLDLAGYWVAETAPRTVMGCHHLHGGIGMDVSYPLHRFSSLIADQVRRLGGAELRLERLACSSI